MTAEQFTYWLQGYMEMVDPKGIGEDQTQIIKDHLKLVFDKQTPQYPDISIADIIYPPTEAVTTPYTPSIDPSITVTC